MKNPISSGGQSYTGFLGPKKNIAPAICYELSISAHSEKAHRRGAKFYLASVAKNAKGATNASKQLSTIARQYKMTTLMCNCTGPCDGDVAAGGSGIWNPEGKLLAQLDETEEALLCFDPQAEPHHSTVKAQ